MALLSRRSFVKTAACTLAGGSAGLWPHRLQAEPLELPLGLQLYSVRALLPKNFDETLTQIGALGYKEVEAAGFFEHTAKDVKQSMNSAGLNCVSAHYPYKMLHQQLDEIIEFAHEVGIRYIVCASPGIKDSLPPTNAPIAGKPQAHVLTLADWRWNADEFNRLGEKLSASGLNFAYHNHVADFHPQDGVVPYDELLRLTNPAKVAMEMDCGWVLVGGGDPVHYLEHFPQRISMLHVKDFKRMKQEGEPGQPPAAELGQGIMDYRPIFRAAKKADIKHIFVEQESFDMPPMQSLKIDAEYMQKI